MSRMPGFVKGILVIACLYVVAMVSFEDNHLYFR